jgi:UDP-N-acetylmuramoyl-tripeptide--D-alanyl-D-alanine ligase
VVLVGGDFARIEHPYQYFEDVTQAAAWVKELNLHDALLLIKGSRSTRMEKILEVL